MKIVPRLENVNISDRREFQFYTFFFTESQQKKKK